MALPVAELLPRDADGNGDAVVFDLQRNLVRRSHAIAEAWHDSLHTLAEYRLLIFASSKLDPTRDRESNRTVRITAVEYGEAYDLDSSSRYKQLISACNSLKEREIQWVDANGRRNWTRWITGGSHDARRGFIELRFSPEVLEELLVREKFISYRLADVSGFRRVVSYRLHEIGRRALPFSTKQDRGMRRYRIEELKALLGIEQDGYPRWVELCRRILQPAVREVNTFSEEMRIELRGETRRRKVESVMVIAHRAGSDGFAAIERGKDRAKIALVESPLPSEDEKQLALFAALTAVSKRESARKR